MNRIVRVLVPALVASVFASGLAATPVTAVEPAAASAPSAEVTGPAETERPDAVSAMVTAQAQGTPVEDVSQRTEDTRVVANPDGTWSSEVASGPVRMRTDDGSWVDLNTTLEQTPAGDWVPQAATVDLAFSDGGTAPFVTMDPTKNTSMALTWPTTLPAPVVKDATLTYRNVVPNGDLVVQALPGGFSHDIVLHQAPEGPVKYEIPVDLDGLQLVEEAGGGLSVRTTAGNEVAVAPEPLMWDAETTPTGEPATVAPLQTTVEGTGANTALVLSPDPALLADPDTQYPVTLDPTFNKQAFRDTWVQNADYTTSQVGSTELRAGTYDGGGHKARSFMDFDTTNLTGKHILDADLRLRNFYSGSCANGTIRAHALAQEWNKQTLTWATQPSVYPAYTADFAPAFGYTGCPSAGFASWNVTGMVKNWTDGTWPRHGVRLKATDETDNRTWRKYRSANWSDSNFRPRLIVNYNNHPNTAGKPAVSPGNVGYATTTTPTIKSTVTDTDGGELRAKFTVYNDAGTEVWTGHSCGLIDQNKCTSAGGTASWTVPAAAGLDDGSTYSVKAWAQDAAGAWSKNGSAATTFKVDTTKPSVTIKASAFTDGMWEPAAPASNKFTLTGSPDTRTFEIVKDKGSATTVTADPAGVGQLSWTVDSGWHTLKVTPYDWAGNKAAEATTFAFGVKEPAFHTPRFGEGSLGVFRLEPQAPSGASSMRLSWRYADENDTEWESADGVTTPVGAAWTDTTADSGSISTPGTLLWDASKQTDPDTGKKLTAPRLLELQACFAYPTETACSDPLQVQLDDGFGPAYPTTDLGPATVALANGHMNLPAADAATGGVALGRVWSTSQAADLTDGPFGRGWSSTPLGVGASETTVIDNTGVDGTFVISYPEGGNEKFTKTGTTETVETYVPADSTNTFTRLELNVGATPDTLQLIQDTDTSTRTTTTWQYESAADAWVLHAVDGPGTATDTAVSSTGAQVDWIAQVAAGSSDTCTGTTQAEGCRGLLLKYDTAGHVTSITRKVRAQGSSTVESTVVATYTYTANLLTRACGLDPDGVDGAQPSMCVSYEYDTTGVTPLLTSVTEPGLAPWRYSYDSAGRVAGVKRTQPGGTGEASWAIDYNLALAAAGLPDMSPAATAEWGQTAAPAEVHGVYSPQADGGTSTTDPTQAQLYYTDVDGTVTNTAVYGPAGWLVDTSWFDEFGNVVQTLDGAGWERVQAAPVADRPALAREASSFSVYNAAGERVEQEYGPVTTATLEDGTTGPFRTHISYVYDDEKPTLGGPKPTGASGPFDLVVEETHAASDPDMSGADHDVTTTRYEYDPVVADDVNGWNLRLPTRTKTQLDDGTWSTAVTRYDEAGNVVESRQPGGSAAANGAGSDAHSMVTIYYTSGSNAQDSDCGNKAGWEGLLCKTKPAAQPTGKPMPDTWVKNYTADMQPAVVEETSGTTVRTTTTTYDTLGRPASIEKKVLTNNQPDGPDLPVRTITYNDQSQQATISADGKTITTTYDTWGRPTGYTDALDNHTVTTYNPAGQVATVDDGAGVYTYTHTPRGRLSSIDVGGGVGSFTYAYTADGQVDTVTYPNGVVADYEHNEAGLATGLTYSQGTETLLSFESTIDIAGRTTVSSSIASEQHYTYDALGRLTRTEDFRDGGCTTRTYGFDASSNRRTFASYNPDAVNGDCQITNATVSETNTFDTAGRITNTGYTYDNLGRAITIPKADTAPGADGDLTATFHADDMIASLSQTFYDGAGGNNNTTTIYDLDPTERVNTITKKINGTETDRVRYRFGNSSDSPSVVETSTDAGESWTATRYVSVLGLGMVASTTGTTTTLHLANLHGDTVATMADNQGVATVDSYTESDEYGNPITMGTQPQRYGWLGSHQRSTDTVGGLMLMGARLYNPATGAFTSQDPVYGGNTTPYTYPQDPINSTDLTGMESTAIDSRRVLNACLSILHTPWQHVTCSNVMAWSGTVKKWVDLYAKGPWGFKNAVRHFMWQSLITAKFGSSMAYAIGEAHERSSESRLDSAVDRRNNRVGRRYGKRHAWVEDIGAHQAAPPHLNRLYRVARRKWRRHRLWLWVDVSMCCSRIVRSNR
jgi:RHS repeat-associated protein